MLDWYIGECMVGFFGTHVTIGVYNEKKRKNNILGNKLSIFYTTFTSWWQHKTCLAPEHAIEVIKVPKLGDVANKQAWLILWSIGSPKAKTCLGKNEQPCNWLHLHSSFNNITTLNITKHACCLVWERHANNYKKQIVFWFECWTINGSHLCYFKPNSTSLLGKTTWNFLGMLWLGCFHQTYTWQLTTLLTLSLLLRF